MVKNAIEMGFHVNFFIYYVKKIKNDQHRTRVLRQLGINYYLLLLKKKQTSKTFFFWMNKIVKLDVLAFRF